VSRKKKHRKGGWPHRTKVPPVVHDRTRRNPSPQHLLGALTRIQEDMAADTPDIEDLQRRFDHLRHLFATNRELLRLRPDQRKAVAALDEFLDANPEDPVGEEAEEAKRQALFDYVIPRVFDDELAERIHSELMEAMLDARSEDDATALMTGLMAAYSSDKGQSPLYQMLLQVTMGERLHVRDRLAEFGLMPSPELLEKALKDPSEVDRLLRDPDLIGRFAEVVSNDPVLAREAESVAQQTEEVFFKAVLDGAIEPNFTDEELAPILEWFATFHERYASGPKPADEDAADEFVRAIAKYADSPASRPAYDRFTRELKEQADAMAPQGGPEALKMKMFADLWANSWRKSSYCRTRLLLADMKRRSEELGEYESDEVDDADPQGALPFE